MQLEFTLEEIKVLIQNEILRSNINTLEAKRRVMVRYDLITLGG